MSGQPALRLASERDLPVEPPPLSLPARIEALEQRMLLSAAASGLAVGAALRITDPPLLVSSTIGAVPSPTAVASPVAQLVTINWSAVAGAARYDVQRSDDHGQSWSSIVASPLSSSQTSVNDYDFNNGARLAPSTLYQYRLVAFDAFGVAHYSQAASVTTSSKHLYDDMFLVGKPDLAADGLSKSDTTGALERIATDTTGAARIYFDQNLFNAAAAKSFAEHAVFVIDLENLKLTMGNASGLVLGDNPPTDPVQQIIGNLRALVSAIDQARAVVPGVQIGLHAMALSTPRQDPANNDFDVALWSGLDLYQSPTAVRDSSYDLLSRLDMVSPENYLWQGQSLGAWSGQLAAQTQLWRQDLQMYGHGAMPIVPGLSPFLYSDDAPVPLDGATWTALLAAANGDPNSDGIRIWAAQQGQFGAEDWSGPDHQAWWNATIQVLNEAASSSSGAPLVVAPSSVQGVASWTYSGAADGFVVERSADGQWPGKPLFGTSGPDCAFLVPAASAVTWTDVSAQSGTTYWYRVRAITAASASAWSDAWQATTPLDGTLPLSTFPNPVSQWTSATNAGNYANGVAISGTATLFYSAMDFGPSGIDHIALDIAEWSPGNDYVGGTLQVFIDRDPAGGSAPDAAIPITDDVHEGPTAIDAIVSGAVAGAPGVHSVWLRFAPPADHPWASAAARSVQFSNTQSSAVVLQNGASGSFYLKLDADGRTLDVWQNSTPSQGGPTAQYVLPNIRSFLIQGAGDTELTLDAANGNPLPQCAVNFTGGSGTNHLEVIGTPGDDVFLYQGQPQNSGAWSSTVLFDWHTINLPDNVTVAYRTNGGADSIGLRNGATLVLRANPSSGPGPNPIRLSTLTLGINATLVAPDSGAADASSPQLPATKSVLVVGALAMMAAGDLSSVHNPLLLGTLDLRDSDMIVNYLDLFGFDIDPFQATVSQDELQRAAVGQPELNPWYWPGAGITTTLPTVRLVASTSVTVVDGQGISPLALVFACN